MKKRIASMMQAAMLLTRAWFQSCYQKRLETTKPQPKQIEATPVQQDS